MASLDLCGIEKSFGARRVLNAVDLSIASGEFLVVVGPSGCGKSTLLRIIAGLERHDAGSVTLAGETIDAVEPKARDVAMVFQSYALYPHMSVAQNLALPLVMRDLNWVERLPFAGILSAKVRRKRAAALDVVRGAAETVALSEYLDARPKQLSGGQRQRVALARALVRRPRLFLLDEPLSNLDAALRTQTRTEIVELQRRLSVTTVYVTHDQIEAMTMADRIAVMMDGDIVQVGTPRDLHEAPADKRVARFIGTPAINLFAGSVGADGQVQVDGMDAPLRSRVEAATQGQVDVGVRAEHLRIVDVGKPGTLNAVVRQVEFLGSDALVHLKATVAAREIDIVVREDPDGSIAYSPGNALAVQFPETRFHVFDASGMRVATRQAADAVPQVVSR